MLATVLALSLAPAALPVRAQDAVLFLRAERVIVRPGEELAGASVIVQDGRIVAVGAGLEAPEGARVIEGAVICAGFLDPWSSLGLDAGSLADPGTNLATQATDGLATFEDDELRRETLRSGVTSVRLQAGTLSRLSGIGAVVRNHPGLEGTEAVVLGDACVGATVAIERGGARPDVFERIAELDRLVATLDKGKKYREQQVEHRHELEEWQKEIAEKQTELDKNAKKAKKDREKAQAEAKEKGKEFKEERYKEDKKPKPPRFDPEDEVMARVADGELPLVVHVSGEPELRGLLEKTAAFGRLRLVIASGVEAEAFAADLARRRIPVLLRAEPKRLPADEGQVGHDLGLAARLAEAGVEVLFGSGADDPADSQDLPTLVALAIAHGLDLDRALGALTLDAAETFDVADRLGSVQVGKDADLLVLDGPPFATTTRVLYALSRGEVVVEP